MKTVLQNCPYLSVFVRICPRRVGKKLDKYFSSVKNIFTESDEKTFFLFNAKNYPLKITHLKFIIKLWRNGVSLKCGMYKIHNAQVKKIRGQMD